MLPVGSRIEKGIEQTQPRSAANLIVSAHLFMGAVYRYLPIPLQITLPEGSVIAAAENARAGVKTTSTSSPTPSSFRCLLLGHVSTVCVSHSTNAMFAEPDTGAPASSGSNSTVNKVPLGDDEHP